MVNKENQNINSHINWSNQFVIPTSEDQDFYTNEKQIPLVYTKSTVLGHDYSTENERNQFSNNSQNVLYFNGQDTYLSPTVDKVKTTNPHLDYSFLLQHNQHMDQTEEEGDEPMIGDGARSYSSIGSTSSRKSQKLSKDDKRKRNTAASARFRVKKKMREKALQSTASEMTEKATHMEQKVLDLEREIKWLKALIVEKDDGRLEQLINQRPPVSLAFPTPSSSLSLKKNKEN